MKIQNIKIIQNMLKEDKFIRVNTLFTVVESNYSDSE